jgi:hypothetical protein
MLELECTAQAILETAMTLGETWIVTNGVESWVESSCKRYLPGLVPTIGNLQIFSARAKYEASHPGDPFIWKQKMFEDLLGKRTKGTMGTSSILGGSAMNLVVLGDGLAEMRAAQSAKRLLKPSSIVKTVKFKEFPTMRELLGQQSQILQELERIVDGDCNMNHGLVQHALPDPFVDNFSRASVWQCLSSTHLHDPAIEPCVIGEATAPHTKENVGGLDPGTDAGCSLAATLGILGAEKVAAKTKNNAIQFPGLWPNLVA